MFWPVFASYLYCCEEVKYALFLRYKKNSRFAPLKLKVGINQSARLQYGLAKKDLLQNLNPDLQAYCSCCCNLPFSHIVGNGHKQLNKFGPLMSCVICTAESY